MAAPALQGKVAAWRALLEAQARVLDHLADELEHQAGLPVTFYEVLLQLSEAPGGRLPMRELAERVLLSKSGLTRLVDRMVGAGLVERSPSTEDRRIVYAVLTGSGRERLVGAAPVHLRCVEQHFGRHLTDGEADTLRSLLERVATANGRHEPPGPAVNSASASLGSTA